MNPESGYKKPTLSKGFMEIHEGFEVKYQLVANALDAVEQNYIVY